MGTRYSGHQKLHPHAVLPYLRMPEILSASSMCHWQLFDMLERRGHHRVGVQMPAHPVSVGQEHSRDLYS